MIDKILHESKTCQFDFRDFSCPEDPLIELFPDWVDYYKTKFAISKILKPSKILEIGVRFGYSISAFLNASPKAKVLGIDNNTDSFGGIQGALYWAKKRLSDYNFDILEANSQNLKEFPGGFYDLIHIDGQQDGNGTFHDLCIAVKQAKWILVDGYFWTNDNFRETNEFLIRYKDAIDFSIALPGYAGEMLFRIKDEYSNSFSIEGEGSDALVAQYDSSYYLDDCGGHESFNRNGPEASSDPRILSVLSMVSLAKNGKLLDLGCGRGEIALQASLHGFNCTGIDYSSDAVSISMKGLKRFPELIANLRYEVANVSTYKPKENYDVIVASDIIEHLSPEEVSQSYEMVSAALTKRGVFIVHTFPNSWFYDYDYPRKKRKVESLGGFLPSDPRSRFEKAMHINEQNPRVLLKQLKDNFKHVILWFNSPDDPTGSLVGNLGHNRLSKYRDLFAIASNEAIDVEKVKECLSFHLWEKVDIKKLSIEITQCQMEVQISESFEVSIELANRSKQTIHSLPPNPINISYHWFDPASKEIVIFDGLRTSFSFPLCSNSSRALQARCQAPTKSGEYLLRLTLVQEQHAWFDQSPFNLFTEKVVKVS